MKIGDLVKVRYLASKEVKECIENYKRFDMLDMLSTSALRLLKARCMKIRYGIIMGFSKENQSLIEVFIENEKRLINIKNILEIINE